MGREKTPDRMNQTFIEFCRACGVIPPLAIEPGRWVRCPTLTHPRKKNASVKLAEDGGAGWVHDFSAMSEPALWKPEGDSRAAVMSADEIASRQAQRRRELVKATMEARAAYEAAKPLRNGHPYLAAKGLGMAGCFGLRVDDRGALVVPMWYKGKVLSIQRITPEGSKWFWPGATTKGASYTIDRHGATLTLLCEGLATGLTLFGAANNSRVVVAFNAGNLEHVATSLTVTGLCAVCADHDRETAERLGRNPGLAAAQKAAQILGAGVAIPECQGTDFDDMRSERLAVLTAANLLKRVRPDSPAQLHSAACLPIRSIVMSAAVYIPPRDTTPVVAGRKFETCPTCWSRGRALAIGCCFCSGDVKLHRNPSDLTNPSA